MSATEKIISEHANTILGTVAPDSVSLKTFCGLASWEILMLTSSCYPVLLCQIQKPCVSFFTLQFILRPFLFSVLRSNDREIAFERLQRSRSNIPPPPSWIEFKKKKKMNTCSPATVLALPPRSNPIWSSLRHAAKSPGGKMELGEI